MEISFVICALFIQCVLMFVNLSLSDPCVQIQGSTCACNSSLGTIDLSPLSQPPKGERSRFKTELTANAVYLYNPCIPIKGTCDEDGKCAVCQQVIGDRDYSAGTQTSASMTGDPDKDTLMIKYQYGVRYSTVKIICDQSQEGVFKPDPGEGPMNHYTFELRTKYGCYSYPPPPSPGHSGISIGSILVIIFFVLLLIYIVAGILFLHYVRGAQGIEMCPNLSFWKDLPFLVKDGVVFVFRGCKSDVTYTKI
ncbi:hypothetical protein ACJMK2_023970 [Sinanodonta woodiana]|uniref:Autophagy-related protein 27 n=1 Tax=Sinanodonta woodiana TaxID=1069815 RepID=A0ABD3T6Q1_SINWO